VRRAFTLIELLVVIGVIALLLAITVPALRRAREMGRETVCRSNLRQLAIILDTYTSEHDQRFPDPGTIYYSSESLDRNKWADYYRCCRWHDSRMGFDSDLLREQPELRGSLWPYLGTANILICVEGRRVNELRGCCNTCGSCSHDRSIPVACQYTYTMNAYLSSTIRTGSAGTERGGLRLDKRTIREVPVRRASQVTRSPAQVFAFAEQNSWAVNVDGIQPLGPPRWPAGYELSGRYRDPDAHHGTLRYSSLEILATRTITGDGDLRQNVNRIGHSFATYHRPKGGDLNTGHSYAAMLDGHVEKITVADQLRRSRENPGFGASRLGPGGNLALAWPLDVPPPGGWENQ